MRITLRLTAPENEKLGRYMAKHELSAIEAYRRLLRLARA